MRESWTDERMDDAHFESMQRTVIRRFALMLAAYVGLISAQTALLLALL